MQTSFRPIKRRKPGSLHAAISSAISQIGTLEDAAEKIERTPNWLYTAADPDVERRKEAKLSYAEACRMAEVGGFALAEHISLAAGGVFVPLSIGDDVSLQSEVGVFSKESGEAVCTILQRMADGSFCPADRAAAIIDIDNALRPLLALRAACQRETV